MAAAAAQTNNRREQIEFPPNVPITLALAYGEPKRFPGTKGERCMFTTVDNRIAFLDPEVAGRITELGINVREEFSITRKSTGKRGDKDEWIVARTSVGERPDGTFAVPKLPEAAPKPPQRASCATGGAALVDEANALVDAYAAVLNRALTTYEGRVKPDEVRSLLLSAYIQRKTFAA